MSETALIEASSREVIDRMAPKKKYRMWEASGRLNTALSASIDEDVTRWTQEGWSQRKIAEELGCDQSSVSRRLARLGVEAMQPKKVMRNASLEAPPMKDPTHDHERVMSMLDAGSTPAQVAEDLGVSARAGRDAIRTARAWAEGRSLGRYEATETSSEYKRLDDDEVVKQALDLAEAITGQRAVGPDEQRVISLVSKALNTDSEQEAMSFFQKARSTARERNVILTIGG